MREILVAVVLVGAGLAGCLQGGEPLNPTLGPDDATADEEAPASDGSAEGDGQADDAAGDRRADDATSNAADAKTAPSTDNGTTEPADKAVAPLPSNVTLANATLVSRSEDQARFRWNGTAPTDPKLGPQTVTRKLTVPPDRWLEVNATLTWAERPGAELSVAAIDGNLMRCVGAPMFNDIGTTDGVEVCESRPRPLASWGTWEIHVGSHVAGPTASGTVNEEPVNFTVELTVENVGPEGPWGDIGRASGGPGAWTPAGEADIRPGVKSRTNSQCTLNVLFTSPDGSSIYAGSAAHCHAGKAIGAMVSLGGIPNAGRLVYCAWGTEIHGPGQAACPTLPTSTNQTFSNDFSLLEIKPSLIDEVNPKVPFWGGPTGMSEPLERGDRALIFGNSSLADAGRGWVPGPIDAIPAVVNHQTNRTVVLETVGTIPGDSGGPALDEEGRALGVASILATAPEEGRPYEVWYAYLPFVVQFMEERTDLEVELLTAPLEDPPYTSPPERA